MHFYYFVVSCPEIIAPPQNITAGFREIIKFDCLAFSYGALQYKWYFNESQDLPREAVTSLNVMSQDLMVYSRLQISKTHPANEGWYCCVATNECGHVEGRARLWVNGR